MSIERSFWLEYATKEAHLRSIGIKPTVPYPNAEKDSQTDEERSLKHSLNLQALREELSKAA